MHLATTTRFVKRLIHKRTDTHDLSVQTKKAKLSIETLKRISRNKVSCTIKTPPTPTNRMVLQNPTIKHYLQWYDLYYNIHHPQSALKPTTGPVISKIDSPILLLMESQHRRLSLMLNPASHTFDHSIPSAMLI